MYSTTLLRKWTTFHFSEILPSAQTLLERHVSAILCTERGVDQEVTGWGGWAWLGIVLQQRRFTATSFLCMGFIEIEEMSRRVQYKPLQSFTTCWKVLQINVTQLARHFLRNISWGISWANWSFKQSVQTFTRVS